MVPTPALALGVGMETISQGLFINETGPFEPALSCELR